MKVWPRAVEETDRQGKPFRNFSEIWGKFYSALWDKLLKICEKSFRNLGEIQRFISSEITQKLFRNYSETISEIIRRKIFLEGKLFLGGKTSF